MPEDLPVDTGELVLESEKALTVAILQLPDKLKDVIVLYYFQNLSVEEVARILGIKQPSVSNRLSRARKKLKVLLEKEVVS